jgi:hypothetical protein
VGVLADIWSGAIVSWNDSAIAQLNPNITLPAQPIVLVFANDRRGSISDSFASALAHFNPAFAMSVYTTNDSFASRWSQFGTIGARSYVVDPIEQQLGHVLVRASIIAALLVETLPNMCIHTTLFRTSRTVSPTPQPCLQVQLAFPSP